jgi:regulator of sigma E protease
VGDARALAPTIIAAQGAALVIDVLRDGRPLTVTAPGVTQESPPLALAGLGIATTGYVWRLPNPGPALAGGLARTGSVIEANVRSIVEIVMGIRSLSELAGPVGIAEFSGDTVLSYGILGLLILTAFLSVNVGVVNLLPIPMLDGGHLVFMAIEAARRKPLSPRVMKICSLGGFWALMVLLLVVTGHDLIKLAF